ncbi:MULTISPECIES: enoyl-CoA hydratase-related protein [Ramlibacter]|jgi:trans-feruloyl-CoA hydratase/vanillin synthase|uniref:p-hydroxycinnamoyl CoA hydratase/lyase n=1 Tax=Ramlibacter pinisoli TaxID=2682844 RepID=A0A6N8J117_9BURK|nr:MULTISPECIES: enoyl-CoA hydratase-related protein [Ramlibacter]MBA2961933.1 enoyl-CoA hydratase/isomerase family protein [Ramlibacter sp. CGMCC 1.13660]MVQ31876.1 p-hydroxycinnamoyl CoA hydratase/lyase [Ramlibacter pinisoli]
MQASDYRTILVEHAAGVARVTLSRPEKRNAMNPRMHEEMAHALPGLVADPAVRVIVITGAGSTFCAGADIKEYFRDLENRPDERARITELARHWMWDVLAQAGKPTIAMVNGHCFGGGFLVSLACDIVVASERAVFGLPEVNWGHLPGGAASLKTIEAMGARMALYYAMTGENFDAATALRERLVTRVVPHEQLQAQVEQLAASLAAKSPMALQAIKEIYRAAPSVGMAHIHDFVQAKVDQLRVRDTGGLRERGMADFIAGKLRTTETGGAKA